MNKSHIIGNLTRDPELRSVNGRDGPVSVCDFTVAVNRRNGGNGNNGQPDADFFRVTAWRGLADVCAQYLAKGRKVAVVGPVSASAYIGNDGTARASLEIQADDVEFLTPKDQQPAQGGYTPQQSAAAQRPAASQQPANQQQRIDPKSGFVQVEEEDLPF